MRKIFSDSCQGKNSLNALFLSLDFNLFTTLISPIVRETWVQFQVASYQRLKMVLDTSLLKTQQYKVRIKGKVEQSWKRSSVLPRCSSYCKGSLLVAIDYGRQLYSLLQSKQEQLKDIAVKDIKPSANVKQIWNATLIWYKHEFTFYWQHVISRKYYKCVYMRPPAACWPCSRFWSFKEKNNNSWVINVTGTDIVKAFFDFSNRQWKIARMSLAYIKLLLSLCGYLNNWAGFFVCRLLCQWRDKSKVYFFPGSRVSEKLKAGYAFWRAPQSVDEKFSLPDSKPVVKGWKSRADFSLTPPIYLERCKIYN